MHFFGVFNREAGLFRGTDMEALRALAIRIFAEHGHSLACRVVQGRDLAQAFEACAAEGDALLAGGGDGTISVAAEAAFRAGIPLAVLPGGTMNLFARSLHVPLDPAAALMALAGGEVTRVDIATANGRPFVHQFSVGIHARLVRMRETLPYHSRIGKLLASLRAIVVSVIRPPNFWAEIRTPGRVEQRNVSSITVTNNPIGEGHVPHPDQLQRGILAVYVAKPMSAWALLKLLVGVLFGHWKASPLVSEIQASEVSISFPSRKSSAHAVVDGELIDLEDRIGFKSHPGALRVVTPLAARRVPVPAPPAD